jgi:hypothetical protein
MNPYLVLGVTRGAGLEEVRTAFRELALANHPDRGGDAREFIRIREAYEILLLDLHRSGDGADISAAPEDDPSASAAADTGSAHHSRRGRYGGYSEQELRAIFERIEHELEELLGRAPLPEREAARFAHELWIPVVVTLLGAGLATMRSMPFIGSGAWLATAAQFGFLATVMMLAGGLAVVVGSRPFHTDLLWYHATVVFLAICVAIAAPRPILAPAAGPAERAQRPAWLTVGDNVADSVLGPAAKPQE